MRKLEFILLATLLSVPMALVGQTGVTPMETGNRVRITAPSLGLFGMVGTILDSQERAVVFRFDASSRVDTLDRAAITEMDISIRRERRMGKSVGIGLLVGAGAGALIGLASGGNEGEGEFITFTDGEVVALGAVVLGVIGGAIGVLAGLQRRDVWAPALLSETELALIPLVRDGGAGLYIGMSIRVH